MENVFLTEIDVKKVRHLENISIPLSKEKRKHLILTGKNGSGKTSVLEALVKHLEYVISDSYEEKQNYWENGAISNCTSFVQLRERYQKGQFILAYYADERKFRVENYENIEKVQLKATYNINENPGEKFAKYLVDLKATQAFARNSEKAQKISDWFDNLEKIFQNVFEDENLKLFFDEESFQFSIHESGREVFDFNTMSSGYAAVFDIINDLLMRMEAHSKLRSNFDMEGVVLVDEIETHLHLELQKRILLILTTLFPNLQFIITTHSPFVLNSLDNAVIYDLEKKLLVSNGLQNLPYEGIVERVNLQLLKDIM